MTRREWNDPSDRDENFSRTAESLKSWKRDDSKWPSIFFASMKKGIYYEVAGERRGERTIIARNREKRDRGQCLVECT